jgi:hypothetical protein
MKRGPKRKPAADRLGETLNIRFNCNVLSKLRAIAKDRKVSVGSVIRQAAEEVAR